jgi:hypothetical protein
VGSLWLVRRIKDVQYVFFPLHLQQLDRAWYDEDSESNPFAGLSEEYTKKKEEQLSKQSVKRVSAHQRQINQVME